MKKVFYIFCLFGIALFLSANELTLVQNGKACCEIIVGAKPVRSAQFAAMELQYALKKIAAVDVKICPKPTGKQKVLIYIGKSDESIKKGFPNKKLTKEFYLVDYKGNDIFLMGNDNEDYGKVDYSKWYTFPKRDFYYRSTTYAVYDFIEDALNVRYYGPGDLGMTFTKRNTVKVKLFRRFRAPSFDAFRAIANYKIEPGMKRDFEIMFLRWRLNTMYGIANHSTWGIFFRYWGKAKSKDKAVLFKERRPELFAQGYKGRLAAVVGKEYPNDQDLPPQLCLTQKGTFDYFAWEALESLKGPRVPGSYGWRARMAGQPYYYAFQEDDNNYFCKCANCQAYVKKKPYVELRYDFINRLAEVVSKKDPNAGISTLCYSGGGTYPKTKLHPKVAVMICLSLQAYYHPGIYARQHGVYKTWVEKEIKNRPLMVWTYMLSPASEAQIIYRYNKFFPFLYPWKTANYMKEFANDGIKGWFGEINLQHHILECYLASRITYNAQVDTNEIIEDYFKSYYGKAGVAMKKFYSQLEKICWDPKNMSEWSKNKVIGGSYIYGYHTEKRNWHYGTPERMKMFQNYIDEALKAAATPEEKARVERFYNLVWRQAVEGRKEFERREKNRNKPISQTLTYRIDSCGGNLAKVPFKQAKSLPEWRTLDAGTVNWKPAIKMLSDDKYLYISYEEQNTQSLKNSLRAPFWENNIEIFLGKRAGHDYFQLAFSPSGKHEFNIRTVVNGSPRVQKVTENFIKYQNTKVNNLWTVKVAIPLDKIPGSGPAVKLGEHIYGNIYRTDFKKNSLQSYSWSPIYTNDYHEGMLKPGVIFLTPEIKKEVVQLNGAFKVSVGKNFPDYWNELLKKNEVNSLSAKNGVLDFGTKVSDLKRYRYLLSTKTFSCKEGDKIIVKYLAKGKGLFAPGMYFIYNESLGYSFLEYQRTKLNSPDKFTLFQNTFTVKSRPGKIPGKFRVMFYAFPNTKLELKDLSVIVNPLESKPLKLVSKEDKTTNAKVAINVKTIDVNGSFKVTPGKEFPNQWKELVAKNQTKSLTAKAGVIDFGNKAADLARYRYLLQTKRFVCKAGDKITVRYQVKGKGLFAPGMYFYYNNTLGYYFLEHVRTNLNSPNSFKEMTQVFTVKNRPGKIVERFVPMFYAFPKTLVEIKDVSVTIESSNVKIEPAIVKKVQTIDINGFFKVTPGKEFPNQWKELVAKNQTKSLTAKSGVIDFGSKAADLARYRYLLQTQRFICKEGDKITVRYFAKGKGLFAPGMYFYYNNTLGYYFLEHVRTNLNSPNSFKEMTLVFTVKNRPNKIVERFVPMFYAFPKTLVEIKDVSVTVEPSQK